MSIIGAVITLVLNFWWIPLSADHLIYGYYGSAWATFICYGAMMILSYLIGQKYFPVRYNLRKFGGYLGLAVLLFVISSLIKPEPALIRIGFHTALLIIFAMVVYLVEKPQLSAVFRKK
jgi:hypothetical protein